MGTELRNSGLCRPPPPPPLQEPQSEDEGALVEFDAADGSFWAPPESEDDSQYDSQYAAAGPGPSFREVGTSEGSMSRSTGGGGAATEGGSTGAAVDEVQRQPPASEQQQGQQLAVSPWQRRGSRVEKIKGGRAGGRVAWERLAKGQSLHGVGCWEPVLQRVRKGAMLGDCQCRA